MSKSIEELTALARERTGKFTFKQNTKVIFASFAKYAMQVGLGAILIFVLSALFAGCLGWLIDARDARGVALNFATLATALYVLFEFLRFLKNTVRAIWIGIKIGWEDSRDKHNRRKQQR